MDHKKGILLVNLGSPDSTETADVRRYLDEFLMDGNVIDVPWLLRAFIVKGIILNTRPKESAHAYGEIWWDEGSPLIVLSERLHGKVSERVEAPVALGMRYGNPSIEAGIESLLKQMPDMEEMLLVPLYPQYAMATTKTVVEKCEEVMKTRGWKFKMTSLPPFYKEESYLDVLAQSMREQWPSDYDHLLFSFHGVPERHLRKTDPTGSHCTKAGDCCMQSNPEAHAVCYAHQCKVTAMEVAKRLGLSDDKWSWSFQSRLGKDSWVKPYTDKELERLASEGVKKLAVACPAFVSDCLETLEEIGMRGKEDFIEAGGTDFKLIPCLNERDDWAEVLSGYCRNFVSGKALLEAAPAQHG